jgi:uncharacterized protein YcfL
LVYIFQSKKCFHASLRLVKGSAEVPKPTNYRQRLLNNLETRSCWSKNCRLEMLKLLFGTANDNRHLAVKCNATSYDIEKTRELAVDYCRLSQRVTLAVPPLSELRTQQSRNEKKKKIKSTSRLFYYDNYGRLQQLTDQFATL